VRNDLKCLAHGGGAALADGSRVRSVLLVASLLAGCVRDAMPGVPEQQESVATVSWREPTPTRIDMLIVIDDSPAMGPYAAGIADAIRMQAYDLGSVSGDVDIHVGVITADLGVEQDVANVPVPGQCAGWGDAGEFRRSVLVDGAFVHDRKGHPSNVTGSVPDALATLADVGAGGCARARPLEAMRIALDHDPHDGGFRRDNAKLAVIIIAAQDDDSPGSLDEYEAFLKQLTPYVTVQIAGGQPQTVYCGEQATDRLYEFAQRFKPFSHLGPICYLASDWLIGGALANIVPSGNLVIGNPCFDALLADVDPATPGVQPECTVTEHIARGTPDEHERLMAACGTGELPCWRVVEDSLCVGFQHLHVEIDRGGEDPPDNDVVEAQCVSS
jgi:hypothetical protein